MNAHSFDTMASVPSSSTTVNWPAWMPSATVSSTWALAYPWSSALKVIGDALEVVGLDFKSGEHKQVRLEPASELEFLDF